MHFGKWLVERTATGFAAIALALYVNANALPSYRDVQVGMLTFAEQLKLARRSTGDAGSGWLVPVCGDVIIVCALLHIHNCPGGPFQ
jgi:hypothetical protein